MKLIKSFSVYTFVGFFGAGINFFIMPLLTHYLSPEDYGILSLFNTYVTVMIPIIGLTAASILSVEYFKVKDKREFASLFSSIQLVPIFPFIAIIIIMACFHTPLALLMEIPQEYSLLILLLPILSVLTIYIETFVSYLVISKNTSLYCIFNILKVLMEALITLVLIVYYDWDWQGRILSWLIVSVLGSIAFFIFTRKEKLLTTNIKLEYLKNGVLFGAPLILHTLGKFVVNQSDRLFIAKMVNLEDVGLYNVGYQIGAVLLIIITSFYNIFVPFLYERLSVLTIKAKYEIVRLSYGFLIILFLILTILTIVTPVFFKIFIDEKYASGALYVFWVGLGYFFWGAYMVFAGYVYYLKKNKILAYLAILNVASNLILNYFLILKFGAIGAAYATCISFILIFLIIASISYKLFPMPWFNFKSILLKRSYETVD